MFGHEPVVGDPLGPHRATEGAADRDLPPAAIADRGGRVASITQRMPTIVEQPFGRSVTLHEHPDTAGPPPPIGTLPTRVRAVQASTSGSVELGDGCAAHGAPVLADHVAEDVDLVDRSGTVDHHASTMTEGCHNPTP